jgi:hypothetical protein
LRKIGCYIISAIIGDIKEIMWNRGNRWMQKAWREQNHIAHNMVQFALKSDISRVSFSIVPLCIEDLVYNDRSHCNNADDIT